MTLARPVGPTRVSIPFSIVIVLVAALVLLGIATHAVASGSVEWFRSSLVVFGSLVIQAMPFVFIGASAAALIEVFVPIGAFERIGKLPRPLQLPAAALAGTALPICECGSVPVARRLLLKGLRPSSAIAFMLASPVVNPIVIASTVYAYRGRTSFWTMVLGRVGLGILVAMAVGWAIGALRPERLLRPPRRDEAATVEFGPPEPRWRRFWLHLGSDFLFLGRYLVIGAAVAAAVQTFLPQPALESVAATPVLDALLLMGLAVLLSLCSESDAFIAASFTSFGPSAQLAFLVFGPMVDLKLAALYAGTFQRVAAVSIIVVCAAVTVVGVTWLGVVTG